MVCERCDYNTGRKLSLDGLIGEGGETIRIRQMLGIFSDEQLDQIMEAIRVARS